MTEEPRVIRLEAQPALVAGAEAEPACLAETSAGLHARVIEFALRSGSPSSGAPFTRYLGCTESGRLRIEAGVPTLDPLPGGEGVESVMLEGGEAVALSYEGDDSELPALHAALDDWMETHGRRPAAPRVESYLAGPLHRHVLIYQVVEE